MDVPVSCHHCSAPMLLSSGASKEVNDVIHLQHIRHQHLSPYKPFRCSKCDQSFTVEQSLAAHSFLNHGEAKSGIEQQYHGSKYLDVLCSLMKQCNVYSSNKKDSLNVQLLHSAKQHSPMPLEAQDVIPPLEQFLTPKLEPKEALPFQIALVEPEPRRTPSKKHSCPSCNKTFLSPTIFHIHQQSKCTPVTWKRKKRTFLTSSKPTTKQARSCVKSLRHSLTCCNTE